MTRYRCILCGYVEEHYYLVAPASITMPHNDPSEFPDLLCLRETLDNEDGE